MGTLMMFHLFLLVSLCAADSNTSQIPLTVTIAKDFLTWKNDPNWDNSDFQWAVLETGCAQKPCAKQIARKISHSLQEWWATFYLDSSTLYQLSLCQTATCDMNEKHGRIA